MAVIQKIAAARDASICLYLQNDYDSHSFIWFITIGFRYSSQHYGLIVAEQQKFPLCMAPLNELPGHLVNLVNTGQIVYMTASEADGTAIHLIKLDTLLPECFPPIALIPEHPLFTKWLDLVPFPPLANFAAWQQKDNNASSIIPKIYELIPDEYLHHENSLDSKHETLDIEHQTLSMSS